MSKPTLSNSNPGPILCGAVFIVSLFAVGALGQTSHHLKDAPRAEELKHILVEDLRAGKNSDMRYFLLGPKPESKEPAQGRGLFIVLPGGDGGSDFLPFVTRIYENSVAGTYLLAQPVSVEWTKGQFESRVWPTIRNPVEGMKFSTEAFVDAVIKDVASRHKIDKRRICTLSWSSGGPAAYAISLAEDSQVKGSLVAMSVFKPNQLPDLKRAKGHAYFLLHSPQDFIPIRMAEEARDSLRKNGATTELKTYQGGHGWRGDPFGNIRAGVNWLDERLSSSSGARK